jgi:hypothetical protein
MNITQEIKTIISGINNADLSEEETQIVMNRMLALGKWEEVRDGLLNILYKNDQSLWNEAILYLLFTG